MSLKAKIEAVIYASEEPVTLAQLNGLLGHEAQAELDHLDAAQQSLLLDAPEEEAIHAPLPRSNDATSELETPVDASVETASEESTETLIPTADAPEADSPDPDSDEKETARESKEEKERARRLREYFRSLLDSLTADYATSERGIEVREVAGGYRLATKPEYHDAVRGFVKSLKPPLKLSLQALETLAVVAYKQPVTAPEISEIRGVDTGGVLGSLMARKLITTAGRKQVIGRPILYKTTRDFLLRFGLKDVSELPSIEEFEKMAGELADAEPTQEEIPMSQASTGATSQDSSHISHHAPESYTDLEPERHTHVTQADGSPDAADNPLDDPLAADGLNDDKDDLPMQQDHNDIRSRASAADSDERPDTVATPEGDNEYPPDAPLKPAPDGLETPPTIDTNKL